MVPVCRENHKETGYPPDFLIIITNLTYLPTSIYLSSYSNVDVLSSNLYCWRFSSFTRTHLGKAFHLWTWQGKLLLPEILHKAELISAHHLFPLSSVAEEDAKHRPIQLHLVCSYSNVVGRTMLQMDKFTQHYKFKCEYPTCYLSCPQSSTFMTDSIVRRSQLSYFLM